MKQKNKKIIISSVIILLIIIAGITVISTWGFNKELRYSNSKKIEIYIEQPVDEAKIKNIANEVLGMHNMVQTVELYKDMITIRAFDISEEQKNTIVNKLKENYQFEQTVEETDISAVPATRIRDMYKQYIFPFAISGILVTIYMLIRYYKKGILQVLANVIIIPIVAESLLLSWIAIARIPMGRFTPILIILVYIASIWYSMIKIEKKDEK